MSNERFTAAQIAADPDVPIIHITRDFRATPAQLLAAHTDAELYARWIGPSNLETRIDHWDARSGGSWRFTNVRVGAEPDAVEEYAFRGCFHEIRPDLIVQTFTYEGMPDAVALETLKFVDLGDGWTRLHAQSLCGSFADREAWLHSGMEVGVNEGYAALEELLDSGAIGGGAA